MLKSEVIRNKILDPISLQRHLAVWSFKDKKIVFTNGCFDILHAGHFDYLMKAADMGDILIIGLNSDDSVRRLKGPGRPINNQNARAIALASLFYVNAVVIFNEDTPYDLIKIVQPDILVKGSDYKTKDIAGHDIVKARGGKVVTVDLLAGYSTTGLIEKLKS